MDAKIKELHSESAAYKEKVRQLTEDLRFFQKIYGDKVKRRTSKQRSLSKVSNKHSDS